MCRRRSRASTSGAKLAAMAPLLDDMTAGLTVDEEPNELRVRLEVAGVPRVARGACKKVAEQATLGREQSARAVECRRRRV